VLDNRATLRTSSTTARVPPLGPSTNSRSSWSATCADSVSTWRLRSCFTLALRTIDRSASYSKSFEM